MKYLLTLFALLLSNAFVAQSACDSISIESIGYSPFNDGIQIGVFNGSMSPLSGPSLEVLDSNGVVLGTSSGQFFAFVPGDTALNRASFSPAPPTPFSGTIILHYSELNGAVTCSFPITAADLCPVEACIPLQVFGYQQGGPFVDTELDWNVTDSNSSILANGVLQFAGTSFGYAVADLCLPPGEFTLHVSQAVAVGNTILVGVTQVNSAYTNGTFAPLPVGGSVDHPFSFYDQCEDGTLGIATEQMAAPSIMVDGRILRISTQQGSALGTMVLLDSTGRVARTITANSNTTTSDLSDLAAGVYVLHPIDSANNWPAQRFVLR